MALRSICPDSLGLHEEALNRLDDSGMSFNDVIQLMKGEMVIGGGGSFTGGVVRFGEDNIQEGSVRLEPVNDTALNLEIQEGRRQEAEIFGIREQVREGIKGGR